MLVGDQNKILMLTGYSWPCKVQVEMGYVLEDTS